jgi:hypothetical protein
MYLSLSNALALYQLYINNPLSEFLAIFCIIFLDNILVYLNTKKE